MVLFIISNAMFLFIVWFLEISIETQFIPTIINGMTSAVSLILAISSVSIALTSRSAVESGDVSSSYSRNFLTILMVPALTLLFAYVILLEANYYLALKTAITSFVISLIILFLHITILKEKQGLR